MTRAYQTIDSQQGIEIFFILGYFLVNCKESIGPPLDDLFLSSQVRESQEIVKKKVNFQFLHYL
ncbi:hypothetical protein OA58_14320 [Microcystis aeruginosa NIES-88]|nr:hypothetical protein OA58_14320 [Microcystis aeruginosa NIES-88]